MTNYRVLAIEDCFGDKFNGKFDMTGTKYIITESGKDYLLFAANMMGIGGHSEAFNLMERIHQGVSEIPEIFSHFGRIKLVSGLEALRECDLPKNPQGGMYSFEGRELTFYGESTSFGRPSIELLEQFRNPIWEYCQLHRIGIDNIFLIDHR